MKFTIKILLLTALTISNLSCNNRKQLGFKPKKVFDSKSLIITQIEKNSYVHTSFKQTNDFGNVPCNGLLVKDKNEVIIFDTPTNDESADELIKWVEKTLNCNINAIIPTHFHDDCLGGLKAFHDHNILSYANVKTIEIAKNNNLPVPKNYFKDAISLKVGDRIVNAKFLGEGHTKDNIVGYFPSENILFGGCLIKELNSSKGYLGDANEASWSETVKKVKEEFPKAKIVVPGHGNYGDVKLLDYTINLFKTR